MSKCIKSNTLVVGSSVDTTSVTRDMGTRQGLLCLLFVDCLHGNRSACGHVYSMWFHSPSRPHCTVQFIHCHDLTVQCSSFTVTTSLYSAVHSPSRPHCTVQFIHCHDLTVQCSSFTVTTSLYSVVHNLTVQCSSFIMCMYSPYLLNKHS